MLYIIGNGGVETSYYDEFKCLFGSAGLLIHVFIPHTVLTFVVKSSFRLDGDPVFNSGLFFQFGCSLRNGRHRRGDSSFMSCRVPAVYQCRTVFSVKATGSEACFVTFPPFVRRGKKTEDGFCLDFWFGQSIQILHLFLIFFPGWNHTF